MERIEKESKKVLGGTKMKDKIMKELGIKSMPLSFKIGMYMGVIISWLLSVIIALGLVAGIVYLIKFIGGAM